MQELEVPDWKERIAAYIPQDKREQNDYETILQAVRRDGNGVLYRTREEGHVTCSGFVMNARMDAVLMVYHTIYDSFSWTGGHADGSTDFLWTAIREAKEETGIASVYACTGSILSLDVLPVKEHVKHGHRVASHVHYNITYGLIGDETQSLRIKDDENQAVRWIPVEKIDAVCKEPHMLPVYHKLIARMRFAIENQVETAKKSISPLLAWYPTHARDLPWRHNCTPYRVWLSEVMLQQTRVEAVKAYYKRFLKRFPDIQSLAAASQDAVNKCWEGLGYYSRAANLRKTAQIIVNDYRGEFPRTLEEVQSLPGIGAYTAGAICSICYGLPVPAADGNVFRVMARVMDCFCEIDRSSWKAEVTQLLAEIYHAYPDDCGTLTQAFMELGATVCVPNGKPRCDVCPLGTLCLGKKYGDVMRLPLRTAKKPRRVEQLTVFILRCNGKYAVQKRTEKGLLHGLWQYPNLAGILTETQVREQMKAWKCDLKAIMFTVDKKHIFTHVEWEMQGVYCECGKMDKRFVWKTAEEIEKEISLPTAFRQFSIDESWMK